MTRRIPVDWCRLLAFLAARLGCPAPAPPGRLRLFVRVEADPDPLPAAPTPAPPPSVTAHPGGPDMAIELTPGKRLRLKVSPVNAQGDPAPVEAGSVTWSATDLTLLSVSKDPTDETVALCRRIGPLGVASARATADADLGAGVETLEAELEVAVTAGKATSLGLSAVLEDDV